jgi:hypothetical protein
MGTISRLRRSLPESVRGPAREAYVKARFRGKSRYCPCCDTHSGAFLPFGDPPKPDRACPHCGSLKRHRLLWLYLERELRVHREPYRVLHVAPERALRTRLETMPQLTYITVDQGTERSSLQADLTRLPFDTGGFDVVICSHVLEHVPADRDAMREMARVLGPGGEALVMVPVDRKRQETYEDPSIVDPAERLKAYGHVDHVRYYGTDIADRLAESFDVEEVDYALRLGSATETRIAAAGGGEIIYVGRSRT